MANDFDAEILSVKPGEFMIEVDKVVSLSSGVPFEYSLSRHLYKDFIFEAVLLRSEDQRISLVFLIFKKIYNFK